MEINGFRGELIAADDTAYDTARAVWDGTIDRRPESSPSAMGPADAAAAVRYARDNDVEIAVRGGGGLAAWCTAVSDDGIVIDLTAMQAV